MNKSYYGRVEVKAVTEPIPATVSLPAFDTIREEEEEDDDEDLMEEEETVGSMEQLSEELITLSNLPKTKWASLPNLEIIKVYSKRID